jgi:hypothetical protein
MLGWATEMRGWAAQPRGFRATPVGASDRASLDPQSSHSSGLLPGDFKSGRGADLTGTQRDKTAQKGKESDIRGNGVSASFPLSPLRFGTVAAQWASDSFRIGFGCEVMRGPPEHGWAPCVFCAPISGGQPLYRYVTRIVRHSSSHVSSQRNPCRSAIASSWRAEPPEEGGVSCSRRRGAALTTPARRSR